jgi:hypothetical protein
MTYRQARRMLPQTVVTDGKRTGVVTDKMRLGFCVAWGYGDSEYIQYAACSDIKVY